MDICNCKKQKVDFLRKNKSFDINEEDIREFLYENNQIDKITEMKIRSS